MKHCWLGAFLLLLSLLASHPPQGAAGAEPQDLTGGEFGRRLQQGKAPLLKITNANAKNFKELVEDAEDGTVIEIVAGSISLEEKVVLSTAVTLRGQSIDEKGVIKCSNSDSGLEIRAGGVKLANLEISDCGAAVQIIQEDEDGFACYGRTLAPSMEVDIDHVSFLNNNNTKSFDFPDCKPESAGLGVGTGSKVTVNGCLFEGNSAKQGAAMMVQLGSSVTVTDSTFKNNVVKSIGSGGAVYAGQGLVATGNQSTLVIEESIFEGNICETGKEDDRGYEVANGEDLEPIQVIKFLAPSPSGGAIYASSFDEVQISSCTFENNQAVPAGGALFLTNIASVGISQSTFLNNHVKSAEEEEDRSPNLELGGAMYVLFLTQDSTISVQNSTFEGNSAGFGGGIHFVAPLRPSGDIGIPTFKNCTFVKNKATHGGGGIAIRNARSVEMNSLNMIENEAELGGGVFITNGGGGTINTEFVYGGSLFKDNLAVSGGGVFTFGAGDLILLSAQTAETRFEGNKALSTGGAMAFYESAGISEVKIQGIVVENNVARQGGGIYVDAIADFRMISADPEMRPLQLIGNKGLAGGALYIRMSGLIQNYVSFSFANFIANVATDSISSLLDSMVFNEEYRSGELFQKAAAQILNDTSLVDPSSINPCDPGGGGAICFAGNQIPDTASAEFEMISATFKDNKALVGGALLLSTTDVAKWNQECMPSDSTCLGISMKDVQFEGNNAEHAGGAIFVTYPEHINFVAGEGDPAPLQTESFDSAFLKNTVGPGGYGSNVASSAVSLRLKDPIPDSSGLIAGDQLSGQLLSSIMLEVKDSFNNTITNGITDAELAVQVISEQVSGQLVSKAVNGDVLFQALTVIALPGRYPLVLAANGVPDMILEYSIRKCIIGEFNITESKICTNCTKGFFGVSPNLECDKCSNNANCTGGPVLVPLEGHWHSTPHSPFIHTCLLPNACSYPGRQEALMEYFSNRSALHPGNTMLPNDVYPQCGEGHEGVLCGSCRNNYGHIAGGTCVKCGSEKWKNILAVVGVGLWTLILTLFTLRSAMASIRDINEVLLMQAAIKEASSRQLDPKQQGSTPDPDSGTQRGIPQESIPEEEPKETDKSGKWDNINLEAPLEAQVANNGDKPPLVTVDHIVAADNLSETVKIITNFLQVVSVALSINTNWTEEMVAMLKIQDVVSGFSGGASVTPMDCTFSASIELRSVLVVVMRIFFPFVIMLIIMVLSYGIFAYLVKKNNPPSMSFDRYLIIIAIVSLFFAYESVTGDLMRILNCVGVDELNGDESLNKYSAYYGAVGVYWGEDTVYKCYEGGHRILAFALGIPGLVLFSVGIPVGLLIFFLWKKAHGLHKEQKFINTYGFLFQNYDERFVYWEVAIMGRKALIGAIVVYAYPLGSNLQGVLAQGVLVVALVLQLVADPYKYRALNLLESTSLVVSIFVYYAGILFNDGKTSNQVRMLVNIFILVANAGFIILFLWKVVHLVDRIVVARLQNFGVSVPSSYIRRMQKLAEVYMIKAKEAAEKLKHRAKATRRLMSKKHRAATSKTMSLALPQVREV